MFDRKDLQNRIKNPVDIKKPLIEEIIFGQNDFAIPEAEEQIIFYHGSKKDFVDSLDFYLFFLLKGVFEKETYEVCSINFRDIDESQNLYKKVSAEEFISFIQKYSAGLKRDFDFTPKDEVIDAMIMQEDWNDVEILGETKSDFYAFYWFTTA